MEKIITISTQASIGFLTRQPMLAHDFRSVLSQWLISQPEIVAELPQLPAIFQRSQDGERLNESSPFRFEAHPHQQWLRGISKQPAELIEQLALACTRLEHTLPPTLSTPKLELMVLALQPSTTPQRYLAPQIIVAKNAAQFERWQASDQAQKQQRVLHVIQKGLRTQAEALGHPEAHEHLFPADAGIQFEWTQPKLQSMRTKAFVRIVTATFSLPCELHGSWAAGPLINKGFGNILRA